MESPLTTPLCLYCLRNLGLPGPKNRTETAQDPDTGIFLVENL